MDRLPFYIDNEGPAIVRRLSSQDTGTADIQPGDTFRLRTRSRDGETIVLDQAMTPDPVEDTITYNPLSSDFATEGIYRAWVVVDRGGVTQDTDEFEIIVMAHAPGVGARTGPIWRAVRAKAPIALDVLRSYQDYGDFEIQRQIDLAKLRVLRSNVPVNAEVSIDPRVIDYISIKVLVDGLLEAAINYWTNQVVQQSARANSEAVQTYPDRIRATESQLKRLKEQLEAMRAELEEVLGMPTGTRSLAPALIDGGLPVTQSLNDFPWAPRKPSWDSSWWCVA